MNLTDYLDRQQWDKKHVFRCTYGSRIRNRDGRGVSPRAFPFPRAVYDMLIAAVSVSKSTANPIVARWRQYMLDKIAEVTR